MNRIFATLLALTALASALQAQIPANEPSSTYFFTTAAPLDPSTGGAGGQVEPSAYADRYLTRLAVRGSASTLGVGAGIATNLPYHLDLRVFGNYTNFDWKLTETGFYIVANIGMSNAGAQLDYYPWKSLRISPGYLFYNTDRIRGTASASNGATITLNNVDYTSDNANPVRGVGLATLGGSGFMATAGWGHVVSRNEKHWHYPFEAGVALINKPVVTLSLTGDVCTAQGLNCQPVRSFPGLQSNLNAELATWNRRAKPFHIYPILSGGVSYTFHLWR